MYPLGVGDPQRYIPVACQITPRNASQQHHRCGWLVDLVCVVYLVSFVQLNKRNRPNNGFLALEGFLNSC
jgi:hypothetical protein